MTGERKMGSNSDRALNFGFASVLLIAINLLLFRVNSSNFQFTPILTLVGIGSLFLVPYFAIKGHKSALLSLKRPGSPAESTKKAITALILSWVSLLVCFYVLYLGVAGLWALTHMKITHFEM
jgi:hypothetical protein